MAVILKPAFASLLFVLGVLADHSVTFINNCPFRVQPNWKQFFDQETRGDWLDPGATYTASVPEIWQAGRMWVQDSANTCTYPDGANCTLLECSFGPENPRFWQCNISVITGFNVPMKYKFTDPGCTGPSGWACAEAMCPITDAYRIEGCNGCLNQCNTASVGLEIELCFPGAPVPGFPKADPPPATQAPEPIPEPQPEPAPPAEEPAPPAEEPADEPVEEPVEVPAEEPAEESSPPVEPSPSTTPGCTRRRRLSRRMRF